MNKIFKTLTLSLVLYISLIVSSFATPQALKMEHSIDLESYQGQTFLQTMIEAESGIKSHLDSDYVMSYTFADPETIEQAVDNFDNKIAKRVLESFENGIDGLKEFAEQIQGEEFTPDNIVSVLRNHYDGNGNIFVLAHFFAMASHAGTLIKINQDNYYYNIGYKAGDDPDDVKSGRSYGATPLHNANDASDVMYLNELEAFLTYESNDIQTFYQTILEFLTMTDTTGFSKPSFHQYAQAAATDFIAIYTAELNRHIMVDLNPSNHPWENDLAEATFVSVYSSVSGLIMQEGLLTEAPLKAFWAMSPRDNGRSGIGIGRNDRRQLQRYISEFEQINNPDLVKELENLIGKRKDGDLFRGLMEYLNNYDTQEEILENAEAITETFVKFLIQVQHDAGEITDFIQNKN